MNNIGKNINNVAKLYMSPPVGTTVILEGKSVEECIKIGMERNDRNKKAGIREQKYQKGRSGYDLSIQGVMGEWVAGQLFGVDNSSLLYDTTPQGHRTDRGDLIIDDTKVDIKCALGNHCSHMFVREQNIRNPSDIYVFLTMERDNLGGKDIDANLPITFTPDETIHFHYHGCVPALWVFQDYNRVWKFGEYKFVFPREKMISLKDAITHHKSPDPILQKNMDHLQAPFRVSFF